MIKNGNLFFEPPCICCINYSSDSTPKTPSTTEHVTEVDTSTSQKNKGMQYYVLDQKSGNENKEDDPRLCHRHRSHPSILHPSREQLSFDELGKIYTNISRRRIVSKVSNIV